MLFRCVLAYVCLCMSHVLVFCNIVFMLFNCIMVCGFCVGLCVLVVCVGVCGLWCVSLHTHNNTYTPTHMCVCWSVVVCWCVSLCMLVCMFLCYVWGRVCWSMSVCAFGCLLVGCWYVRFTNTHLIRPTFTQQHTHQQASHQHTIHTPIYITHGWCVGVWK